MIEMEPAVGRYMHVHVGDQRHRIYFEEAGEGPHYSASTRRVPTRGSTDDYWRIPNSCNGTVLSPSTFHGTVGRCHPTGGGAANTYLPQRTTPRW